MKNYEIASAPRRLAMTDEAMGILRLAMTEEAMGMLRLTMTYGRILRKRS